ncbi:E3 ubiquitin-protein ligase Topors-like [Amblyomma americanum]
MATNEVEAMTPSACSGSSAGDGTASTPGVKLEPGKGESAEPSTAHRPSSAKTPERPVSPEQSCAICLGPPENKSFTDSCFHTFCFSCLLEWSKVKAECPLCKQRFKSIVHNVRSFEDYDRYFVNNNAQSSASAAASSRVSLGSALLLAHHLVYSPTMLITWHPTPRRRSVLSFSARSRSSPRSLRSRSGRADMMRATAAAAVTAGPLPTSSTERRSLYELDLWVCPPNNRRSARRFTPVFFRENPACTHRLIPWLNRELVALLGNSGEAQLAFATELVLSLITRFEVCSLEFAEHVRSFFGERTAHFLHELAAFVSSPLDMVAYDRVAVYDTRVNVVARGSPAAQFLQPPAFEDDNNGGGELALTGRAPVTLGSLSLMRDPSQPGPSGLHHNTMVDLAASESEDSDCMVITPAVPVRPRTPVVIELSSDDDEQGRAASATATASAPTAVPVAAPTTDPLPQMPRRKPLARKRMSVFWSSDSDSSTASGSDYEDDKDMVTAPAHRRCIGASGVGMHRKQLRMLARSPAASVRTNGASTRLSTAALDQPSSSSGHRQSVVKRKRMRRRAQQMAFSSDED